MERKIIRIDEEKCNGCGLCIPNCHEGALQIIEGKARLISDLFCDGLGACIGHCPEGAIEIIEREAEPYNEQQTAVGRQQSAVGGPPSAVRHHEVQTRTNIQSELRQWPVQLHLLNPNAPYFRNADVVLTADCVPFAMGDFHAKYLKGRSIAIACPKLDSNKESYVEKLTAMITGARINSLNVVMMEVPCCGGLLQMALTAREQSGRNIPVKRAIISLQGEVLEEVIE
jgi:NAD-dependent dihydropyrimidine dehydrogenase PreA subunit